MRKLALVTGASRGIGYAIAQYLASQEMDLILLALHPDGLHLAKQSIMAAYPKCQVSTAHIDMNNVMDVENQIDTIIESHPPISILINSAGVLRLGASEMPAAQLLEVLTINLISTLVISNKLAAQMKLQRAGHIFTLASLAGLENKSTLAAYTSSKAGLISYNQALYSERLPYDVNRYLPMPERCKNRHDQ